MEFRKQAHAVYHCKYHIVLPIWSDGYCVSTVGINEAVIRQYIEDQGKEDTGQAKLELG